MGMLLSCSLFVSLPQCVMVGASVLLGRKIQPKLDSHFQRKRLLFSCSTIGLEEQASEQYRCRVELHFFKSIVAIDRLALLLSALLLARRVVVPDSVAVELVLPFVRSIEVDCAVVLVPSSCGEQETLPIDVEFAPTL